MTNEPQKQKAVPKPSNEIDMQALTTFPYISSDHMSDRVRNKFREFEYVTEEINEAVVDAKGNFVKAKDGSFVYKVSTRIKLDEHNNPMLKVAKDLWANMELFTQDFRLGNLNKEESFYVRFNIDLCSDILTTMPSSFHKPALILLERSISVTETSQSKGGFLRRMFNTFYSHSNVKDESPTKRSFFGLGKKNKSE